MPADRSDATSTSFAAAAAAPGQVKLSSHGPTHPPTLQRGQACTTCRSRKIRCSGDKPTCKSCAKSAKAHGEEPIPCDWTEAPKRRRPNNYKVAELQDKLEHMERLLQRNSAEPALSVPPTPAPQPPPFIPYTGLNGDLGPSKIVDSSSLAGQSIFPLSTMPLDSSAFTLGFDPSAPPTFDFGASLLLPYGWSTDLPCPSLLNRLIDVFFTKSHFGSDIMAEDRFRASMKLPPTHSGYPPTCLLHAMAAAASDLVSDSFISEDTRYWLSRQEFGDWHSEKAKSQIQTAFSNAQGIAQLRIVQASCLISQHEYTSAQFSKAWLSTAKSVRLSAALGLQSVRSVKLGPNGHDSRRPIKAGMLSATDDPTELAERAATFHAVFSSDIAAAASTGWAQAIDDRAMTTLIPPPHGMDYPTEDLINSPLCHLNPSFLITHPPHLCGTRQIYFKAWYLLGRVCTFLNQAPEPIGLGLPLPLVDGKPQNLRERSTFKRLDSDITQFRLSLPREYQSNAQVFNADQRHIMITAMPQFAGMLLHEPFFGVNEADPSAQKCILAARSIMDTIHTLQGSSFEVSGFGHPFLTLIWGAAGRTLVRQLALKQLRQNPFGVEQLVHDISTIIAALERHPSPVGVSASRVLSALLADPTLALPPPDFAGCEDFQYRVAQPSHLSPYTPPSEPGSSTSFEFDNLYTSVYTEGVAQRESALTNTDLMELLKSTSEESMSTEKWMNQEFLRD